MSDDETLKATLRASKTRQDAANALGITKNALKKRCQKRGITPSDYLNGGMLAAKHGDHPGHRLISPGEVAPGYAIRGVSTLVGADGAARLQWVKTTRDHDEQLEALREAMADVAEEWRGQLDPIVAPDVSRLRDDLINVIPVGDPHFGMYAWAPETGEDYDLSIAESDHLAAIDYMVRAAPKARTCSITLLGDNAHADNRANVTEKSGHPLDVDSRYPKVGRRLLRAILRMIDSALATHAAVRVRVVPGNHDWHTSIMLGVAVAAFYERESRVEVQTCEAPYVYERFGRCLFGYTHGDKCKIEKLGGEMACARARDWGETDHRVWFTGHVHHDITRDLQGCQFHAVRILAPRDSFAAGGAYHAGRDVKCWTFHRDYGEINRQTANIKLVRAYRDGEHAAPASTVRPTPWATCSGAPT